MISPEILNVLKSNLTEPSYAVVITDFKSIENCNNDKIIITTEQINPHPLEVIKEQESIIEDLKQLLTTNHITIPSSLSTKREINSIIEKKLSIESLLDFDSVQGVFISRLNASINNEKTQTLERRLVKGTVKNNLIKITDKDYPNYFNYSKFKVKNNKLIISIPKRIKNLQFILTQNSTNTTYTQNDVVNNKLTVTINNNQYTFALSYTLDPDITMQAIESISTTLKSEIYVEFSNIYQNIPGVIVTTDKESKNYSSYDLDFIQNQDNEYIGVIIQFRNVKRNKAGAPINITVIGDEVV